MKEANINQNQRKTGQFGPDQTVLSLKILFPNLHLCYPNQNDIYHRPVWLEMKAEMKNMQMWPELKANMKT